MTHLIPIEHQVDLARLARYYNLKSQMEVARSKYFKLFNQSMNVASTYLDSLDESKTIIRLRREIRLATKGTPQTIAEDSITSAGYVSFGTEQLYNAQSHLVKSAYRMVAPLVHPDRGGDVNLFQLVNSAYRLKDLTFLQETYLMLVKDNVFWRCSTEAADYMLQEIERPKVSLTRLRTSPEFQIVMFHRSGAPDKAQAYAQDRAKALIYILQSELNWMLNPNPQPNATQNETEQHHGNDNKEESGIKARNERKGLDYYRRQSEGRDSTEESQHLKDWINEGSDSAGESTTGTGSE